MSAAGCSRGAKRGAPTPTRVAQSQKRDAGSWACSRGAWSAASSSKTMRRAAVARSLAVRTSMPARGSRMQDAASTRSPAISTMQARQLPSAR